MVKKNAAEKKFAKEQERLEAERKKQEAQYWDPMFDQNPNYEEERRAKSYVPDFEKAINQLDQIQEKIQNVG